MLSLKIKKPLKIRQSSLITVLVKVIQRNRNKKIYISQLTERASQRKILFYFKELAHIIMEIGKSKICRPSLWVEQERWFLSLVATDIYIITFS